MVCAFLKISCKDGFLKQAISTIAYSGDLNVYLMMAYVISSVRVNVLIKYGFILLKIFQISDTAVS